MNSWSFFWLVTIHSKTFLFSVFCYSQSPFQVCKVHSISFHRFDLLAFSFLFLSKLASSCGCYLHHWNDICLCSSSGVLCPFGGFPSPILHWGWNIGQRLHSWEWRQSGVPAPSSDQGQREGRDVLLLNQSALSVAWLVLDDYSHS
jgi:hypothetical protein